MKRTAYRFLWPLVALVLSWGAPVAMAQTGAAVVRPDPASLTVVAGQIQTISVLVENAAEVYGIDIRASFDPALIEIVDADAARDGVQMTPGAFPQPDFVALNLADNAAGALRYAATQINPTPPASGSGVVFTFQVRGRANGVSPLRIELVEMANRSGELLSVTTQDATLTVTGGSPAAATGIALTPAPDNTPGDATTPTAPAPTPAPTISAAPPGTPVPGATASGATTPGATTPGATFPGATASPDAAAAVVPPGATTAATVAAGATTAPAGEAAPGVVAAATAVGAPADSPATGATQPPGSDPAPDTAGNTSGSATAPALAVVGGRPGQQSGDAPAVVASAPAAATTSRAALLPVVAVLVVLVIGALLWQRGRSR